MFLGAYVAADDSIKPAGQQQGMKSLEAIAFQQHVQVVRGLWPALLHAGLRECSKIDHHIVSLATWDALPQRWHHGRAGAPHLLL
jgi:hypothetical protein